MRDVRKDVFGTKVGLSIEFQQQLIKEALTAISFGARANVHGWREKNGSWSNTALVEILKNPQQRSAFLASELIQSFIKEQSLLDTYLAEGMREVMPDVYFGPLITRNIKPSKSKAVAYMYQMSETQIMNIAYAVLEKNGIKPIARIHDAFIVRHKISIDLRSEIIEEMKDVSTNTHWKLKSSEFQKFVFLN